MRKQFFSLIAAAVLAAVSGLAAAETFAVNGGTITAVQTGDNISVTTSGIPAVKIVHFRPQGGNGWDLRLAEIIEGTRKQHGNSAGCCDRLDAVLIEIFNMIDGKRTIARRQFGATEIGELFGMELHRQAEPLCRLEHLLGFGG